MKTTTPKGNDAATEGRAIDALVIERLMTHVSELESRLLDVESGPVSSHRKTLLGRPDEVVHLESQVRMLQAELAKVNERAANMRLDRQLRVGLGRIRNKVKDAAPANLTNIERKRAAALSQVETMMALTANVAVICGAYPGGERAYGGQFIKSRVDAYYRQGFKPVVIEVSARTRAVKRHKIDGVDVLRVNTSGLAKVLRLSNIKAFGVHALERPVWEILKPALKGRPLFVWVHGFEARAWEELAFNFTEDELSTLRPRLENANRERRATMADVMQHPDAHMIYVSQYMRIIAEGFASTKSRSPFIIPNPVSPIDFPYSEKTAEDRKSLLWLRSFSAHNYASDISRDVILGLSKQPFFDDLKITIVGDGKYFDEMTAPLSEFENITIQQGIVDRKDMRRLFRTHGVKLVPSRWDSHGLTACEAMHSGLVPLTSAVAGLREYIDPSSAVIGQFDEVEPLVEGYAELYNNPEKYLAMSAAAHAKSARLCGPANTTDREIKLMKRELSR